MNIDQAYAICRRIAHRFGANFSVGFRFLPRRKRRAVYAAYAYCRWADDIADESGAPASAGPRLPAEAGAPFNVGQRLDDWERELGDCYAGQPNHPITIALADALKHFNIPKSAFVALINGCRQDMVK